jgi:hypothetical protein
MQSSHRSLNASLELPAYGARNLSRVAAGLGGALRAVTCEFARAGCGPVALFMTDFCRDCSTWSAKAMVTSLQAFLRFRACDRPGLP